jgi:hypothetical protein
MQEENKVMDIQDYIRVESLPKIFYQLEEIGKVVDNALVGIEDMVCDEDNKKEVKKRKQEITAFKDMMEDRRKQIKSQVMAKYDEFNKKYEEEVKSKLVNAESVLTEKYTAIETQQKLDKENELREFVEQHCKDKKIHIDFERIGLNITLSASIKSLKEQALNAIEKVASDLKLIELEEYKDEILLEYNKSFDFVSAKMTVIDRHKQLEEIKRKQEELEKQKEEEQKIVENVEAVIEEVEEEIIAPVEIETTTLEEEEERYVIMFTVRGTKSQLKELKLFLQNGGYDYD